MSHKGTGTFVMQRASAVILIPLAIWFLISLAAHAGDSHQATLLWLKKPLVKILFGAFVSIGAIHGRIGIGEIIEDYIHGGLRGGLSALNWIVALAVIVATWWALFTI